MSEMTEEQRQSFNRAPELSAIECARRGDPFPLADRIENGKATAAERKACADSLRGRFKIRHNPKTGKTLVIDAYEGFKAKLITAYVLRECRTGFKKNAVAQAMEEFGRGRSQVYAMVRKYQGDPECRDGIVPMPWRSRYFLLAWAALDGMRESSLL
jgi:hypothetical protein